MRLTAVTIDHVKAPKEGQKTYFDDTLPGFGLRVSQGGAKSFVVMYGKTRKLKTLGRYPTLSLAEARRRAKAVQGDAIPVPPGITTLSFAEARDRYLEDTAHRTRPRTVEEYARLLKRHFPFEKKLVLVTRADIAAQVSELRKTPAIEKHAYVAIKVMMNWAVRQGLLAASPVPPMRFSTTSRSRVLTDDELKVVWQRATTVDYPFGCIIQLLILTGQRRGEVAALRRSWITDEAIIFPASITKNKREHRIPLGDLTREIIATIPGDTDLLFPARGKPDQPFNGWSKAKREFDKPLDLPPYTLHDLRRTFASNLARLGTPVHVTEKLLNHVSGTISGVAAVYNRHEYWEEMREAVSHAANSLARFAGAQRF